MGFGQKNPSGSGAQSAAGDPIRTITGFAADPLLFRGAVADGPVRSGQLGASDCSPVGSGLHRFSLYLVLPLYAPAGGRGRTRL